MTDEELHGGLINQQGSRQLLNTPVLIIDLSALDANISAMADFAADRNLSLRPHTKTHKSPELSKRQLKAGAIGVCCAKIGEAEVMADEGVVQGLHITSPVVSPSAISRLAALNLKTEGLMCVVDNLLNVQMLGAAFAGDKPLKVIIDIDPGIHRTGVATPEAAVALLAAIRAQDGLQYAGVQCYCGAEQHIADYGARRAAMDRRATLIRSVIAALTEAGGPPDIVTGGGTGTHRIDADLNLFTELQVGSYVFMDSQYLICDLTGDAAIDAPFKTALNIDARVVSSNTPGMVTVDAGFKAFSTDADEPIILGRSGAKYRFMGDEHGAVIFGDSAPLRLGDVLSFEAPHCDPTVNLYDTYHVVEGDTLRALWPVAGRGRSR